MAAGRQSRRLDQSCGNRCCTGVKDIWFDAHTGNAAAVTFSPAEKVTFITTDTFISDSNGDQQPALSISSV